MYSSFSLRGPFLSVHMMAGISFTRAADVKLQLKSSLSTRHLLCYLIGIFLVVKKIKILFFFIFIYVRAPITKGTKNKNVHSFYYSFYTTPYSISFIQIHAGTIIYVCENYDVSYYYKKTQLNNALREI
jgi:hypothetical protein